MKATDERSQGGPMSTARKFVTRRSQAGFRRNPLYVGSKHSYLRRKSHLGAGSGTLAAKTVSEFAGTPLATEPCIECRIWVIASLHQR
jgi:hypothetical protein